MKKLLFILAVIFFAACSTDDATVSFSANGIQSGSLKSFDIKEWQHFHYPYRIDVTMVNTETNQEYHSYAPNGSIFFSSGTEFTHIPEGNYVCSVSGGGYVEDSVYSASYYIWSIKDTIVFIPSAHQTIIRFNLDKTSALVIKDATTDLKLIANRNADLFFTSRGEYDFAYVTPAEYAGLYTDSLGYQHSTEWFTAIPDNYYYFFPITGTKSVVTIPTFNKNEISIKW